VIASPNRTYTSLDTAYDHFNRHLFGGQLPRCLITMQRHKGAYGYFSPNRFASVAAPEEVADEIALNPAHFAERSPVEVLSTLVHEMAHVWQQHWGKPSRNGYHNKEWAGKMREIGLTPSATADPGKDTGQNMTHTIDSGGPFDRACARYLHESAAVLYHDRAGAAQAAGKTAKKKAASKTKYTCPVCGLNAWAKPGVILICGECSEELEPEELDSADLPSDDDTDREEFPGDTKHKPGGPRIPIPVTKMKR
jgi:hypothetical protein